MTARNSRHVLCAGCKQTKPHEAKGFCKACYQRQRTQSLSVQDRQAAVQRKKEYDFEYRKEHKEQCSEASRTWERENRQRLRARRKVWRERNKGPIQKYNHSWHNANPGASSKYAAGVRSRNPERWLERHVVDAAKRRALLFACSEPLTLPQVQALKLASDGLCAYCLYPSAQLELEHCTPLSRGGSHEFENTVFACRHCNRVKHAKTVLEFCGLWPKRGVA